MKTIQKSVINSACYNPDGEMIISDSHRYANEKGEISLLPPCRATWDTFEIYCTEGNLFEDIERYDTLELAEKRINELLG